MASKKIVSKRKRTTRQKANRWIGHPVYVLLNDGSYYGGVITGVDKKGLILSGAKGSGLVNSSGTTRNIAQISGFWSSLFGGSGLFNVQGADGASPSNQIAANTTADIQQAAVTPGAPGMGNLFGRVKKMWPTIKVGYQVVKQIMPIFGMLKI